MPVLPRQPPQLTHSTQPRDLPALSLSSDALLKPLDVLKPAPKTPGGASKRDLPPLSLSTDALIAPLAFVPLLGPQAEDGATGAKRARAMEDSEEVVERSQSSSQSSPSPSKRDLPRLALSTDSLLNTIPVEGLPLLLGGEEEATSAPAKRDASPLLKLDSGEVLDKINSLNPLRQPTPPEKRQDSSSSSKAPPFVQLNTLQFLDKLGRVNLLDPLSPPPPAAKRDESSGKVTTRDGSSREASKREEPPEAGKKSSGSPPIVRVNTLQFLDKLGKTNLLDPLHARRGLLLPRQNAIAIPTQYAGINSGPAPGTVAGIVLGSVAGFLLIVWLLWLISNGGGVLRSSTYIEDDVVVNRRRSRSPGTRRSHRSQRTEMTSRSPRRERVVRQERIVRDRSMPAPRETSRLRDTVIIDEHIRPERRVDGDDIVEVIEEHSSVSVPPPRRTQKSRRGSGYRRGEYSDI